jgi:hypothetical protein
MKKLKIMLIGLAVVATVGGALAFKAKSPIAFYCSDRPAVECPFFDINQTFSTLNYTPDLFCTTDEFGLCDKSITHE